jgi:1-acyl-sn-glycerol-3-phosphate acyltransferase
MGNEFDDIRPYNDAEIPAALKRFVKNRWLISGIRREVFPRLPSLLNPVLDFAVKTYLRKKFVSIHTVDEFQRKITRDMVLTWIVKHTTDGLSHSGLEHLQKGKAYIFISNHRDIVLDSALMNYVLSHNGFGILAIAFGANLMITELVSDLIRANKSFMVERDLPFKQRIQAAHHLSLYIWFLNQEGESVWIAQREGRAKDGDDRTSPALIKMLYMSQRKGGLSFSEYIQEVNIVPVAVSYEKDPCDLLKARELHKKGKHDHYEKKKDDDLLSMYNGLKGDKGRIHFAFAKPLQAEYQNEQEVARDMDWTIHSMYKVWPTNYIAYDELNPSKKYSTMYSAEERADFLRRFQHEREDIRRKALAMYAQPVINRQALESSR